MFQRPCNIFLVYDTHDDGTRRLSSESAAAAANYCEQTCRGRLLSSDQLSVTQPLTTQVNASILFEPPSNQALAIRTNDDKLHHHA